ncbi:hypothetical protein PJ747_000594 [Escherichia coli]|nr:hypothetical protein [Escherichia coli]EEV4158122.1 hypothetical protein [Escherichia coli]EEV4163021.1 hypothetical protein [Escherichia coli]EEV5907576.1 hypothetical protein [Escherichia coli]EEW5545731.1 hypothetical protein [Escherichia coli]
MVAVAVAVAVAVSYPSWRSLSVNGLLKI